MKKRRDTIWRSLLLAVLAGIVMEGGLAAGPRPVDTVISTHLIDVQHDGVSAGVLKFLRALAVSMDCIVPLKNEVLGQSRALRTPAPVTPKALVAVQPSDPRPPTR